MKAKRADLDEEVFERQSDFIRAVRMKAVVAQADAEAGAHPVQKNGGSKGAPVEEKESRDGSDMKSGDHYDGDPIPGLLGEGLVHFGVHKTLQKLTYFSKLAAGPEGVCKSFVISEYSPAAGPRLERLKASYLSHLRNVGREWSWSTWSGAELPA